MSRLGALAAFYACASLLHFAHNALLIDRYPHLPAGLTAPWVVAAWVGVTSVALAGWLAARRGRSTAAMALIALWASLGFDGLGHYLRAPITAHTVGMNVTIWAEVAAAAALLTAVLVRLARPAADA